jgi:hypothetical protein
MQGNDKTFSFACGSATMVDAVKLAEQVVAFKARITALEASSIK